jgi:hypothetical protein
VPRTRVDKLVLVCPNSEAYEGPSFSYLGATLPTLWIVQSEKISCLTLLVNQSSKQQTSFYPFTSIHVRLVQVSKEPLATGRSNVAASAKITIATARVIAMGIQVIGTDVSGGITPSRNLVLSGSADQSNVILSWTLTSDTDARQLRYSVSADGRTMTIPPNALLAGASYRVTLNGRDSLGIGSAGQASLTFNVQGVPSGGTVSLFKGPAQVRKALCFVHVLFALGKVPLCLGC